MNCDEKFLTQKLLERERLICQAQNFLKNNQDQNGTISAADNEYFEENFLKEKKRLDSIIEGEMSKPACVPVRFSLDSQKSFSGDYRKNFFNEIKNKFRTAHNTLQESQVDRGGYLVPAEFHDEIVSELKSENVLRQICNVVQTENDRKICIVTTSPTADFFSEGAEINLSTERFSQKTLSAYKLCAGVSVTNELLQDSFYNIEEHLQTEFSKSIGAKEEESLLTGQGTTEPLGLHTIIADNSTTMATQTQTAGTSIAADDLINLAYSLKRPYRKNSCWLMNDVTLAEIRKLKNSTQDYLFQPSLTGKEPDRLLGYPVYTSEYMPSIAGGNIPILFGDFSKFLIGQRGEFSFKPLYELHALRDLTTFLMIERIDGVLTDSHAVRGLRVKP